MSTAEKAWLTVVLLTVTTFALRAFGPFTVGARAFGPRTLRVLSLLPAALLAALVVTETVIHDDDLDVDARLAGVGFAGILLWREVSVVWVVLAAAAVTALLRLAF
jgi:branched-subunit amino acid transport protein